VNVQYADKSTESVMVYYPTQHTISQYNLQDYITDEDPWRIHIEENHPEIIKTFPEMKKTTPP
jgi:hypothetical protein